MNRHQCKSLHPPGLHLGSLPRKVCLYAPMLAGLKATPDGSSKNVGICQQVWLGTIWDKIGDGAGESYPQLMGRG